MTDWIDFSIYTLFLVTLWFVNPTTNHRLAIPMLRDRNAEWLEAHPDFVRKMQKSRWNLWLGYTLGAVSIGILASLQLGFWTPEPLPDGTPAPSWLVLWQLTMASMIVAIVVGGSIGLYVYFRLRKLIPPAPRRWAALDRRSIDDFVPRWARYAAYALIAANLAAWAAVGLLGTYATELFWGRFATFIGLSAVFFFFTRLSVNRRPNVMDRILGLGNRRAEVRFNFACQILPPVIGAVRLYEEVNDVALMDINRTMGIALALMVIFGLLRTVHLPPHPDLPDTARRTRHDIAPA